MAASSIDMPTQTPGAPGALSNTGMAEAYHMLERHRTMDERRISKYIGIALAVSGNLLISGALNVQKHVHNQNERLPPELQKPYTRMPLWWLGLVLTVCGELGNFAAYGFAEASLVTPLGAVSVMSNAFIAAIVLREGLRMQDLCGCVLVVGGSAIIAASTTLHEDVLDPDNFLELLDSAPFIAYSVVLCVAIALVYAFRERYGRRYVWYYVLLCSMLGSITVMASKGLSSFVNTWMGGGKIPWTRPTPYVLMIVLVVTGVLQVKYLNIAMRNFGNTETVPVFFVLFTLCTITASSILYRDFEGDTPQQICAFCFGCLVTFAGVKLITSNRRDARQPNDSKSQPLSVEPAFDGDLEPAGGGGGQTNSIDVLSGAGAHAGVSAQAYAQLGADGEETRYEYLSPAPLLAPVGPGGARVGPAVAAHADGQRIPDGADQATAPLRAPGSRSSGADPLGAAGAAAPSTSAPSEPIVLSPPSGGHR